MSENPRKPGDEEVKLEDNVQIVLTDKDGTVKEDFTLHNLTTTVGKNGTADQLLASPTIGKPTHMAIGTTNTTFAVGTTALGAEVGRVALGTKSRSGAVVTMVGTFPAGTGTGTIQEAGIFDASSAGNMYVGASFTAITKASSDSLTITWTYTIS